MTSTNSPGKFPHVINIHYSHRHQAMLLLVVIINMVNAEKKMAASPQMITFLYDITSISSGSYHNLCIGLHDQLELGTDYAGTREVHSVMVNPYSEEDKDTDKVRLAKG